MGCCHFVGQYVCVSLFRTRVLWTVHVCPCVSTVFIVAIVVDQNLGTIFFFLSFRLGRSVYLYPTVDELRRNEICSFGTIPHMDE